jgi:hypothetical protein
LSRYCRSGSGEFAPMAGVPRRPAVAQMQTFAQVVVAVQMPTP